MTTKRLKIVSVRLQGQTDNAYPLGDPSGVWHGDMWLTPAAPDPLVDEILAFTHATRDLLGPLGGTETARRNTWHHRQARRSDRTRPATRAAQPAAAPQPPGIRSMSEVRRTRLFSAGADAVRETAV